MGDAENSLQPSKKRAAGREISRDNPGLDDEEEGTSEQEMGTFKKASDEVLAGRRIVKVARRSQTASTAAAQSSNPFAGIRLVPPPGSATTTAVMDETKSNKSQAESEANVDASKEKDQETNVRDKESERKVDEPKDESTAEKDKIEGKEDEPESTDEKAKNGGEGEKPESAEDKDAVGENSESKPKEDADPDKDAKKDPDVQKTEDEVKKDGGNGNVEKSGEAASFNSFQQLSSSQNAFTGFTGTGFSSTSFSFGSIAKEGSSPGSGSGSIFGMKNDQPPLSFGLSNNGSSLFGTSGTSASYKSEGSGFPSMQEVPMETGEENEKPVFTADSVLFEYLDGSWKERGKGEVKVNISTTGTGKARLIMRTRGNYRLILNASLFPDMKLTNMDKKGITFACVNSVGEGKDGLSTFALKFKDASIVDEFRACVLENKGKMPIALKTPENSPKATDD